MARRVAGSGNPPRSVIDYRIGDFGCVLNQSLFGLIVFGVLGGSEHSSYWFLPADGFKTRKKNCQHVTS